MIFIKWYFVVKNKEIREQHFRGIWLVTVLHVIGLHAEKLTWLQLHASWPLAGERLDFDLSEKPVCCWRVKNVTNYPHASCVLLVWNNHNTLLY